MGGPSSGLFLNCRTFSLDGRATVDESRTLREARVDETSTPFAQACTERGWAKPSTFIPAFEATAELVGEQVTITDRQVRRWRRTHPPRPHPPAWRVLHALFGVSPTDLGFPGPEPNTTADMPHAPSGEVNVDRRTFVADTIGVAAGVAVGPREGIGIPEAVGTAHLLELREGLRSLYTLDNAYGGGDVRSLAVRHLRRVRRIINTSDYPDTVGRQLQLLVGETAEHCAWLYYDADEQDTARRYWTDATEPSIG
ncbi:hypothetical protein ACFP51_23565 [Streptomyces pratens]|uniref:Uncharacterized protein n=2 Tax=Streptomyces pratens TaxID=887456 RepID=A0ABW1LW52_9ACTN